MDPASHRDLTVEGLLHDLKNVFETMHEASDLLAGDPQWKDLAAILRRAADHGARIAGSLREPAPAPVEFADVLAASIQFTEDCLAAVRARQIRFFSSLPPGLSVPGPAPVWERILTNLFLNAARMLPAGKGEIHVTAAEREREVEIRIGDNGPGFSAELLHRVFEPHVSTDRRHQGLGLHIVASLLSQWGGSASAANREGGGAEVTLRLPRL
jgi:signal transduction histidine kinase